MKSNKVIVTVPVTGSAGDRSTPFLPITPREIAESAVDAGKAGASVVHIHVRDMKTGRPSMDFELYREVVDRIRDQSDMIMMKEALPAGAVWTAFGISANCFPMAAQSVLLGGQVRVGMEDNLYLSKGQRAASNRELVEKAVRIIRALDKEPATPDEARELLQINS
jgi:uncharacterized protein (DUF849 family)